MQSVREDFQHATVIQGLQRQEETKEFKVHLNSLESTSPVGLHHTGMVRKQSVPVVTFSTITSHPYKIPLTCMQKQKKAELPVKCVLIFSTSSINYCSKNKRRERDTWRNQG